ncbi:MAG: hypothetical protein ABIK28_03510 [Planctomycetota bacterium]
MSEGKAFKITEIDRPDRLARDLIAFAKRNESALKEVVHAATAKLQGNIKKGIMKGTRTGRLYEWMVDLPGGADPDQEWMRFPNGKVLPIKMRNKPHQASAPGEFPKTDTGILASSIMRQSNRFSGMVGTDLKYGGFLEEGTKYMEARPYMEPSAEGFRPDFFRMLEQLIKRNMDK